MTLFFLKNGAAHHIAVSHKLSHTHTPKTKDLRATAPALAPMVRSYRGGYTKVIYVYACMPCLFCVLGLLGCTYIHERKRLPTQEDRRAIEAALFGNELLGVTATCALELGRSLPNQEAGALSPVQSIACPPDAEHRCIPSHNLSVCLSVCICGYTLTHT